jgi:copper homeostasis protein (lipoprotein)
VALPCPDCEGIETVIDLNSDYTYQLHQKYLGKGAGLQNTSGTFSWTENGSKLVLKVGKVNQQIQVGENRLFWLDQDGKRITGALADHYILTKQENTITEKYWKLVTLIGEPVKTTGRRQAHIILKQEGGRLTGHGGCNAINGSYLLKETQWYFLFQYRLHRNGL